MEDEELVREARDAPEGDLRAFERLVERHQARVRTNCRFLTGSPADAEDLAQEVLVKAYFGLDAFEGKSKFRTWLNRIKVNHCLNHLRKHEGRTQVPLEDPVVEAEPQMQTSPDAERAMHAADQRERIQRTLESLPETLRLPLVMRDLDRLSYQEIADALGLGLSAVKMRIKRGREEFRRRFQDDPSEAGATP